MKDGRLSRRRVDGDAIMQPAQGGAFTEKQPNSRSCFACGIDPPRGAIGLHLSFYTDDEWRCVARFRPQPMPAPGRKWSRFWRRRWGQCRVGDPKTRQIDGTGKDTGNRGAETQPEMRSGERLGQAPATGAWPLVMLARTPVQEW